MNRNTQAEDTRSEYLNVTEMSIKRVKEFDGVIFFDMLINGITIYGCRVVEREGKPDFVAFPSHKGKDGKYYNICYAKLSPETEAEILNRIEGML